MSISAGQRGAAAALVAAGASGNDTVLKVRARLLAALVATEHPAGRLVAAALGETADLTRLALEYAEIVGATIYAEVETLEHSSGDSPCERQRVRR